MSEVRVRVERSGVREDRGGMSGAWRVRSGVTQRGAGQIQPGDRLLLLLLLSPRSFIPPARGVGPSCRCRDAALPLWHFKIRAPPRAF